MHLTYRPATEEDVESCVGLILETFMYTPGIRPRIAAIWRSWLRGGLMQMTVLEDETRPPQVRRVAFGNSVFVTDSFMREARAGLPPYIAAQITERYLAGNSPILDSNSVRKASASDGLNLAVLHIGWQEDILNGEEIRRVKAKLVEAFFFAHAGYPIRDFMEEVCSLEEMRRGVAAGLTVYNDYTGYWAKNSEEEPIDSQRPYLLGIDRDNASEGSYVAPIFLYTPPRFFFTSGEQELLRLALIDKTDSEMARALHISESAIQKRWQSIFDRAIESGVRWLPVAPEIGREGRVRGVEKRRHLLSYLRSHPEELRPAPFRRDKPSK
jgi:hypothetical protein